MAGLLLIAWLFTPPSQTVTTTTTTLPYADAQIAVDACGCERPYQRGGGMYRHVMCELAGVDLNATDALQVLRWAVGLRP